MLKIKVKRSAQKLRLFVVLTLCVSVVAGVFTVPQAKAAGLAVDVLVTKQQTSPAASITSPTFTTSQSNELLLAFIASDGPGGNGTQRISSVSGGGLTWTLRKRVNAPGTGTSEIWQAVAPTTLRNVSVKANRASGSYVGLMTVVSFTGASLTHAGATGGASARNGAASASLTTTRSNSWVWGVGNDWDRAAPRTLGTNQTKVSEVVNSSVGDTQWVQRQTTTTPAMATTVTLNTTAPTIAPWNLATIEIPSASADNIPPAAPLISSPVSASVTNDATPTFSGSGEAGATLKLIIDNIAPLSVTVDGTGKWSITSNALPEGVHTARATQTDAAGNVSPESNIVNFTTDTVAPLATVDQKSSQVDPTNANSASFTVVFSEAIVAASFTASDLRVTGTSGAISELRQLSTTVWEIIVTGMTSGDSVVMTLPAGGASDMAGNTNTQSTSTDNSVTYDENLVAAPIFTAPASGARLGNPSPPLAGTGDNGKTIHVQIDGEIIACLEGTVVVTGGYWACTPALSLAEGAHIISAIQTANSSQSPSSTPLSIIIDTVSPGVTVNQKITQADPTTENRAVFTVEFTEAVDGNNLGAGDFVVEDSSGTVTSLVQLTDKTWEAIVTGMTSGDSVKLSLSAGATADLAGNLNSGSTSTDNSVLYQASAALKGWQITAANTGLAAYGMSCSQNLPVYTGPTRVPAGTVISGMRITTPLILNEGGVTIEKSCLQPTYSDQTIVQTWDPNAACPKDEGCPPPAGLSIIRDSEFDGSRLSFSDQAYTTAFKGVATLQRNYIHNVGSGIGIIAAGKTLDALIEQNYVVGLVTFGNGVTHSDAFTIRDLDASQKPDRIGIVRNNRFNCDGGDESGALFLQAWGKIHNVTVEGNLLEGGGYQLTLGIKDQGSYGNIKAIDNRFSGTGWGAVNTEAGPGWTAWQQNYYNNSAAPNNQGSPVSP